MQFSTASILLHRHILRTLSIRVIHAFNLNLIMYFRGKTSSGTEDANVDLCTSRECKCLGYIQANDYCNGIDESPWTIDTKLDCPIISNNNWTGVWKPRLNYQISANLFWKHKFQESLED